MPDDIRKIRTRDARTQLDLLIEQVEKVGTKRLRQPAAARKAGESADEWLMKLKTARTSLEQWCGDPDGSDKFSLDVEPKA